MGNGFFRLFKKEEMRILMCGLDNAGKTTILYGLKDKKVETDLPTVGFNVEKVTYKGLSMYVWDVGGQEKFRLLWKHYYSGSHALIFVLDSNDRERFAIAKTEMLAVINDNEMLNAFVCVYANKQDIPGAMSCEEVHNLIAPDLDGSRVFKVFPVVAKTQQNIWEGFKWIIAEKKLRKKKMKTK